MSLDIELQSRTAEPLYVQVAERLHSMIVEGLMPPGSRMPAVRKISKQLSLSYQTVNRSYELLRGRGLVERRMGSGTYVKRDALGQQPISSSGVDYEGYRLDTLRFGSIGHLRSLGSPLPDLDIFHKDELDFALREAIKRPVSVYGYAWLAGDQDLLQQLSRIARSRGISAMPGEILTVPGATSGLSISLRVTCREGDKVLVPEPCYIGFLHLLRAHGLTPIAVECDAHGMLSEAVSRAAKQHQPKLLFVDPTFSNPTGQVLPIDRRKHLLSLSNEHGFYILEDDVMGRLDYDQSATISIKGMDRQGRVIYVDSLSKCLAPALRVGFVIPPRALREDFASLIDADLLSGSAVLQIAAAIYLAEGFFEKHVHRMQAKYRAKRDAILDALTTYMPKGTEWTTPAGGLCLWVTLPPGNYEDLYKAACAAGVPYTPGDCFLTSRRQRCTLRLSFGSLAQQGLRESVETLASLIKARASTR